VNKPSFFSSSPQTTGLVWPHVLDGSRRHAPARDGAKEAPKLGVSEHGDCHANNRSICRPVAKQVGTCCRWRWGGGAGPSKCCPTEEQHRGKRKPTPLTGPEPTLRSSPPPFLGSVSAVCKSDWPRLLLIATLSGQWARDRIGATPTGMVLPNRRTAPGIGAVKAAAPVTHARSASPILISPPATDAVM
jgi:hypothetical protein